MKQANELGGSAALDAFGREVATSRPAMRDDLGAQPAKRGSGLPFTPNPLIANRLPPSGPGSMSRIFMPIEVA